jgi:hypothetical protein
VIKYCLVLDLRPDCGVVRRCITLVALSYLWREFTNTHVVLHAHVEVGLSFVDGKSVRSLFWLDLNVGLIACDLIGTANVLFNCDLHCCIIYLFDLSFIIILLFLFLNIWSSWVLGAHN